MTTHKLILKRPRTFRLGQHRITRRAGSSATLRAYVAPDKVLIDFGAWADWFHKSVLSEFEVVKK